MKKPNVIEFEAEVRGAGSTPSKQLRDQKLVPAVIYGPGVDNNLLISLPEIDVEKLLSKIEKEFVLIKIDGKEYTCLIYDVDFHPVTDRPTHVDLYATRPDSPVTITVPIRLEGVAPGITEGGRLYQPLREIQIKCLPEHVPAEFVVNIGKLNIGNSLKVRRIKPKNLEILTAAERTIVVIRPPKGTTVAITELDDEDEDSEGEDSEQAEAPAEAEA
ncbi:MAG: 50S ribosomal protein L25 [Balneolia bacterium]|nr:50S ribosomal protein L25 [Balneolia bacterium]